MSDALLISVDPGEVRTALVRDGRLAEYAVERLDATSLVGNIYLGRVARVVPGIDAAFVDCGLPRAVFLAGQDGPPGEGPLARRIHEGEVLVVQVTRDAVGDKGPRVTTRLSLAGRLLVLCPGGEGVAVSRRITDPDERERLTRAVASVSRSATATVVIRTAAEGCDGNDLAADLDFLVDGVRVIESTSAAANAPALLRAELGPVERALRDRLGGSTGRVIIDDRPALTAARAFAADHLPDALDLLEGHAGSTSLFRAHDVEDEIAGLSEPRVSLPSGGALIIQTTEALTVIDVDSAGHTARAAPAGDAAIAINLEAAREIARQLRLRDIGGPAVVDFIGMADDAADQRVVEALASATTSDPAPVRFSAMSEFGMVELTRKRVRPSVFDLLTEPCPTCDGGGRVKTARTVAGEILRAGLQETTARPGRPVTLIAAPAVVDALRGDCANFVVTLERAAGASVALTVEAGLPRDRFEIAIG